MIKLTQLNGQPIVINPDLILSVQAAPDTHLHMATGTQFIVREGVDEVIERVVEFRRLIAVSPPVVRNVLTTAEEPPVARF